MSEVNELQEYRSEASSLEQKLKVSQNFNTFKGVLCFQIKNRAQFKLELWKNVMS